MPSKISAPPEWLTAKDDPAQQLLGKPVSPHRLPRSLYDADEGYQSYLVDKDGNAYEPYAMAWRYLGMYLDCDLEQNIATGVETNNDAANRRLVPNEQLGSNKPFSHRGLGGSNSNDESGDNDDDAYSGDCSRKVLWAAYHDPRYQGNQIGEYQFYDSRTHTWDASTCQSRRCAKMDCHASRSRWKLVGVFKEADGLYDFAEQLFKHQGYCLWDADKEKDSDDGNSGSGSGDEGYGQETSDYEFMANRVEYLSGSCQQMYLTDNDGNTVYRGVRPLPGGNLTEALYTDEQCSQRSNTSFERYIQKWYYYYYGSSDTGQAMAELWQQNTVRWNDLMADYHVCQPCRAYNTVPTYEDDEDNSGSNDHRRRWLNDENDGEGDEELWGYNCYDDAGYRNCNQCHKFETKTDLEPATAEDLARASHQGTIRAVKVDGIVYGRGGIDWHDSKEELAAILWTIGYVAILGFFAAVFSWMLRGKGSHTSLAHKLARLRNKKFQKSLRETLVLDDEDIFVDEDSVGYDFYQQGPSEGEAAMELAPTATAPGTTAALAPPPRSQSLGNGGHPPKPPNEMGRSSSDPIPPTKGNTSIRPTRESPQRVSQLVPHRVVEYTEGNPHRQATEEKAKRKKSPTKKKGKPTPIVFR